MDRLLSVVTMGLVKRWKSILIFLGIWWIFAGLFMKIFANGDFTSFGVYFPIYFDNEVGLIILIIGIAYIIEQFRLESQLGLTRNEQIQSLFIQTIVDSLILTFFFSLLLPLRDGITVFNTIKIESRLSTLYNPENLFLSIAAFFAQVLLIHLIANVIGIVMNKMPLKTGLFALGGVTLLMGIIISGVSYQGKELPDFVKFIIQLGKSINENPGWAISTTFLVVIVLLILVTRKHQSKDPNVA
mgnify:FL=1